MLQKDLWKKMFTKLFVYAGPEHKHEAQKPEAFFILIRQVNQHWLAQNITEPEEEKNQSEFILYLNPYAA